MMNYVYGSATTLTVLAMLNIIDENIPNSLAYYVDLVMPF